ncbi:MAG: hypothetical protein AAF384_18570 [Pseudomonadota bacterium]
MMEVRVLQDSEFDLWQQYVSKHNAATFFHDLRWRAVFEGSLGHKTHQHA